MQLDGSYSIFSPVVHRDIVLSINTIQTSHTSDKGFSITFNTVQVILRPVVLWTKETSAYSC